MSDSTNVVFDDNDLDHTPEHTTGYAEDAPQVDTSDNLAGLGTREFPDHLWIDPKDWKDKARENDKYGLWPEDYINRQTNQTPTHECTTHALLQNMEIAWNRQREGQGMPFYASALSVYAEANPRQWGGSSMQKTLGIAMRRGMLPEHNGPDGTNQRELYKHTLNLSSGRDDEQGGPWVRLSNFPDGWNDTSRHFKPLEVINIRTWEQSVCVILNGICDSVGRRGHAIPYVKIVWRDGRLYARYSDSYRVFRYDSVSNIRAGVGGSYGIVTTTTPDDWSRPAGKDMR